MEDEATAKNRKGSQRFSDLSEERRTIAEFVERAQDGDKTVLPALRKALDEEPKMSRILVDLARSAESGMVEIIAGEDLLVQEAMPRNLAAMRKEIAGENPSPLERLLAERIAACWLQLQYFDAIYAQNLRKLSISQSEYYQRRIDRAHKRYLSAIRTLAQVRKLLKPSVAQINIAERQVNTAG